MPGVLLVMARDEEGGLIPIIRSRIRALAKKADRFPGARSKQVVALGRGFIRETVQEVITALARMRFCLRRQSKIPGKHQKD